MTKKLNLEQLKSLFAATGMTEAEYAEKSGITIRTMRKILAGEVSPTLATITKLASGLNVIAAKILAAEETAAVKPDPAVETHDEDLMPEAIALQAKMPRTKFLEIRGENGNSRKNMLANINFISGIERVEGRNSIRFMLTANGYYEKSYWLYENFGTETETDARYEEVMRFLQEE